MRQARKSASDGLESGLVQPQQDDCSALAGLIRRRFALSSSNNHGPGVEALEAVSFDLGSEGLHSKKPT